ncbi:lectin like domain-containing protein [Clostridium sp. D33t1_170424_F3]|uniref:lectin like domain-containing protein n=1 Tax=Clostridium sp. D33t1_170424_F3 TaxID=2787099 RepID=UPI0018A8CADF|nr:lectin like domain-containing protein [Clostridium sp. D33t1_170424_F3]
MKTGNKIVSLLIACSMLTASFSGTMAFAKTDRPTPEPVEGEVEMGTVMGYSRPGMDTSYMLQDVPKSKALARAAAEELPSAYNTVDDGRVTTEVRDQAGWGTCWAFAATGAIASSLYDELQEDTPVLSPVHMAYFTFHAIANPDDPADKTDGDSYLPYEYNAGDVEKPYVEYTGGGNTFASTSTFARGMGPVLEEEAPYPEPFYDVDKTPWLDLDPDLQFHQEYRLNNSNYLPKFNTKGELDTTAIKKALYENGGSLEVAYNSSGTRAFYYNEEYEPAMLGALGDQKVIMTHYTGSAFTDCGHAVQIVGWDDNIPKEYFQNSRGENPEHDGGWLIRNSWGDWSYMHGYFYMSYDEGSITEVSQYNVADADEFDHNYQYDGTGWSMSAGGEDKGAAVPMANIFKAVGDETLQAVSFYTTDADAEYAIQVYTNTNNYNPTSGVKAYKAPQTGTEAYPGYHTIYLDEPVNLNKGEYYSVVVTMKNPLARAFPVATEMNATLDNFRVQAAIKPHQSFISVDGGKNWIDMATVGKNYTAHSKRVDPSSQNQGDWTGNMKPGTSGVNIEVAGDFDGDVWDEIGNVCLKAFTTNGQEGITPVEAPSVKVKYSVGADVKATGDIDETYDFPGYYEGKIYTGDTATLSFVPYAEGREFAGVTVNGEADDSFEKNLYTYEVTGGEEDTALNFAFTIVNKLVLNTAIEFAKEAQGGEEYAAAMPTVQKLIDKALTAAEAVAESKTADQAAIDKAWKDLIDVIQLLQFRNGDMTALEFQLTMASQMNEADFTVDSWNAMIAVRDKAQAMFDAKDSLQEDIDAMTKELKEAITALVHATSKDSLQRLVDEASAYDLEEYLETGKAEFQKVLAAAVELLKDDSASQAEYNVMETRLAIAMAALRKIPDKNALDELNARFEAMDENAYTKQSFEAYRSSVEALNALVKSGASDEEIGAAYYMALDNEEKLALKTSKPGSGNSGSSGSSGGGSSYGGAGTAVVGAGVAQAASVVSDTTVNFTLKRGAAYCFKMTVVNGNGQVPSFTVGNGEVLKTQFVAQIGNAYYYRVWAIGAPGQSAGVYTTLQGSAAVKHCTVTIG